MHCPVHMHCPLYMHCPLHMHLSFANTAETGESGATAFATFTCAERASRWTDRVKPHIANLTRPMQALSPRTLVDHILTDLQWWTKLACGLLCNHRFMAASQIENTPSLLADLAGFQTRLARLHSTDLHVCY
jgi:hypothetical protein